MADLQFLFDPLNNDAVHRAQRGRMSRSPTEFGGAHRGPGWFDSSWELWRGLEVREGLPCQLDLREWLELCVAEPLPVVLQI